MKRTLLIVFGLYLAGFAAYRALFGGQTVSWHQRLTVTVETPAGEVSGAAVTAVENVDTVGALVLIEARGVHATVTGEAVVVEVAPGRYLFALLDGESSEDAAHWAYAAYGLGQQDSYEASMRKLKSQPYDVPVPLPPEGWPLMVTFDDVSDPKTVRQVDPDDLDAAFGCDIAVDPVLAPWRTAGQTYREWVKDEIWRLAKRNASARAGLTGEVAATLDELFQILKPNYGPTPDELARIEALRKRLKPGQEDQWRKARDALLVELPATLPSPQKLAAKTGGPCHALNAVTLEVTKAAVTKGKVVAVLGWLDDPQLRTNPIWAGLPILVQQALTNLKTPKEGLIP